VAGGIDSTAVFLDGALVVAEALADPAVAGAWDGPSVLEDQRVSGLAGHLGRGGVWVVADYLDGGTPEGPLDVHSAAEYFAAFAAAASADDHRAIRQRGAAVAAVGHDQLVRTLHDRLGALGPRLRALDHDHPIAVVDGTVMPLHAYLVTRIVEQAVHLDDLARSVEREPWAYPAQGTELALAVAMDVARRRHGDGAVLRALYRRGWADAVLPVL
jgi:hypothetical protein